MAAVFSLSVPPHLPSPPPPNPPNPRPRPRPATATSNRRLQAEPQTPHKPPKLFPSSRPDSSPLSNKLRLSSKLNPPPPPPLPSPLPVMAAPPTPPLSDDEGDDCADGPGPSDVGAEFRQSGKIFVGNLLNWAKKHEVAEFFRQFGPIKEGILIRGYKDGTRNAGFGFVIYDRVTVERSAMRAVEFDGIEFHEEGATVKLDDGKVEGEGGGEGEICWWGWEGRRRKVQVEVA